MVKHKHRDKYKVEEQFSGSATRHMWQGLLMINDYKKKPRHIMVTNATLPDVINTFFSRLEYNDPELPRRAPDDNMGYTLSLH